MVLRVLCVSRNHCSIIGLNANWIDFEVEGWEAGFGCFGGEGFGSIGVVGECNPDIAPSGSAGLVAHAHVVGQSGAVRGVRRRGWGFRPPSRAVPWQSRNRSPVEERRGLCRRDDSAIPAAERRPSSCRTAAISPLSLVMPASSRARKSPVEAERPVQMKTRWRSSGSSIGLSRGMPSATAQLVLDDPTGDARGEVDAAAAPALEGAVEIEKLCEIDDRVVSRRPWDQHRSASVSATVSAALDPRPSLATPPAVGWKNSRVSRVIEAGGRSSGSISFAATSEPMTFSTRTSRPAASDAGFPPPETPRSTERELDPGLLEARRGHRHSSLSAATQTPPVRADRPPGPPRDDRRARRTRREAPASRAPSSRRTSSFDHPRPVTEPATDDLDHTGDLGQSAAATRSERVRFADGLELRSGVDGEEDRRSLLAEFAHPMEALDGGAVPIDQIRDGPPWRRHALSNSSPPPPRPTPRNRALRWQSSLPRDHPANQRPTNRRTARSCA